MATAPRLPHLLALVRQLLLRTLKHGANALSSALTRILRKLVFIWSICRSRFVPKQLRGKEGKPSLGTEKRSTADSSRKPTSQFKESRERSTSSEEECRYTLNPNGETISLESAAFSLYPFSGNIHNASRSSQNLSASIQAHTQAIASRSRSASPYASSFANSNADEDFVITVHSPVSPAPRRQYSLSSPEFHNPVNGSVIQLNPLDSQRPADVTSIDIPYVSSSPSPTPVGTSQQDPQLWTEHNGIESPRDIDETSIRVPVFSPPTSPFLRYLDNPRIAPVMPESNQRYTRRPRIPRGYTEMTIEALTYKFEKPLPPAGWSKIVHPEGARYFFNKDERVYTDADLYDPTILKHATDVITTLKNYVSDNQITLPQGTDLVIDVYHDDEKDIQATYYYVSHSSRSIFFLDTYDATSLPSWYEIEGIRTECHLGHEIEAQYWYFVQFFPSSLPMSHALASELRDMILHFIGDSMTSHTTTAPYTLEDLFKILPLTNSVENNIDQQSLGAVSFVSRQMFIFARSRFLNYFGEAHARLERNFSVHGAAIHQRTWLVKVSSMFLFSAPDFHLRNLQEMWVDGVMNKNVWQQSVKKMIEEWEQFVLFGTVMLNANVAFLAIQSVDTNRDPYRSPAQISSYFSVIASIGSIVLGLLLIRQNRTKSRESVEEVQAFLARRSHPRLGLETLAILHSLPYALLMWGMVSFMAAFAFECFEGSNTQTRALVGSFSVAVATLILWAVVTSWEKQPEEDEPVEPMESAVLTTDDIRSSRSSQKSCTSQGGIDATPLSRFLTLPVVWLRKATVDSARTVVQPESV